MKCRTFQPKLSLILIPNLLFFCLTSGHHLWSTSKGQKQPSADAEGLQDAQTRYYGPQHYRSATSSQNLLSPQLYKRASSPAFVLNRKLHNLDKRDTPHAYGSRFAEQPNQTILHYNHQEPERNDDQTSEIRGSLDRLSAHADPFFISIEGKRFYGGLITYTHDLHPARICRVMNACIRNDDTLILPQWMQRHDNTLKFQCGYSNIEFSMSDNDFPPSLKKIDLVGITASRPSMPDFIADFIPSAVVFDLVYGGHQVSQSCHSRKGEDCYSFPTLQESFTPAVILHPRIRTLAEKKSWVRQFIDLMKPPDYDKGTEILYADSIRETDAGMTCFRSALFTRGPFNRNFIMEDHLRQIHFLDRHGIARKPREVLSQQHSVSSGNICSLNVTITNRKLEQDASSRLIGRYITNVPAIIHAIFDVMQRIPGLHLNIATVTLEDKSLRWQINAMQNTDIWVAGHGPLLTNMLFLREKSSVLEIQPFTYYPQTYEKMAERLAHVSHERYIADPDVEAFKTCMNQIYDAKHAAHEEAFDLLHRYMQASKKYFESDNTHSLVLHSLTRRDMHPVRKCAQMQRLTVNAHNFAVAVVRHARIRCGLPKPT